MYLKVHISTALFDSTSAVCIASSNENGEMIFDEAKRVLYQIDGLSATVHSAESYDVRALVLFSLEDVAKNVHSRRGERVCTNDTLRNSFTVLGKLSKVPRI